MSIPKWVWYAALAIASGVGTGVGEFYWHQHEAKVDLAKADQHGAKSDQAAEQHVQDHKTTIVDDAQAKVKDQTIAWLKAQLAAMKHPAPTQPGSPAVVLPLETPIERKQDEIITAEDDRLVLANKQIADRDKELADAGVQIKELRLEVGSLRATIASFPKERKWGIGVTYGSNSTEGVTVVRSFGPFEVGADVVQESIGGGQKSIQVVGRALWRF